LGDARRYASPVINARREERLHLGLEAAAASAIAAASLTSIASLENYQVWRALDSYAQVAEHELGRSDRPQQLFGLGLRSSHHSGALLGAKRLHDALHHMPMILARAERCGSWFAGDSNSAEPAQLDDGQWLPGGSRFAEGADWRRSPIVS
jgi:hypothetical protein